MAGFVYSRGISIIHLAQIVSWFYAIGPDLEMVDIFVEPDVTINKWNLWRSCNNYVNEMHTALNMSLIVHIICFVNNLATEIFEFNIDAFGALIRFMEVIIIAMNTGNSIYAMCLLIRYFIYQNKYFSEEE